ncbi:MAG: DNA repair exonuclease [Gammaproteobacteria bacterium]|nr:DNA repair exonuclease [Gammaproteobacteria bacterium]
MGVRLLHTADWQIGKGFGTVPGDKGAALRNQRLETVGRLAALATELAVDAVLVAGDVFDAQTVSDETLRRVMERLRGFAGPWVLLPGNHDATLAESVWTRLEALGARPANVHFALTPEPLHLPGMALAILPAPLQRRHEPADLTAWFAAAETPPEIVRVGLAHGSVTDFLPAEAARHNPIERTRAGTAGLDYLALGDWHGTLRVDGRTWYAGTPETDRFRSRAPGHALVVDLDAPGVEPRVETVATTRFHWHTLEHRLGDGGDLAVLEDRLQVLGEPFDRHVVALLLSGVVGLAERVAIEEVVERWRARFHFLDVDDAALTTAATEADLAALQDSGFVAAAAAILRRRRDAGEATAGDALQMLFAEYRRRQGG